MPLTNLFTNQNNKLAVHCLPSCNSAEFLEVIAAMALKANPLPSCPNKSKLTFNSVDNVDFQRYEQQQIASRDIIKETPKCDRVMQVKASQENASRMQQMWWDNLSLLIATLRLLLPNSYIIGLSHQSPTDVLYRPRLSSGQSVRAVQIRASSREPPAGDTRAGVRSRRHLRAAASARQQGMSRDFWMVIHRGMLRNEGPWVKFSSWSF